MNLLDLLERLVWWWLFVPGWMQCGTWKTS